MRLAPGQAVGRYDVLDLIGEGGMSESYRARDRETGQVVVLKVPYANVIGDPGTYSRYQRETEIGRRLDHPHIQRLLDTGHLDDSAAPYIVWEYVEGEPLRRYLDERAPLLIDEAVELARQLADALEACHAQHIVHRDLKPENVLISPDHQLKLLDFGIALLQGARRLTWSRLSNSVGTPDYMAPEQIRGEEVSAASDTYALGCVMYESLCGRTPFADAQGMRILWAHLQDEPPDPRKFRPELSDEFARVLLCALQKEPAQRPASAGDYARLLSAAA